MTDCFGDQPFTARPVPSWYRNLEIGDKERVQNHVVDSIEHYGSLTPEAIRDIGTAFRISSQQVVELADYFTSSNYTVG